MSVIKQLKGTCNYTTKLTIQYSIKYTKNGLYTIVLSTEDQGIVQGRSQEFHFFLGGGINFN